MLRCPRRASDRLLPDPHLVRQAWNAPRSPGRFLLSGAARLLDGSAEIVRAKRLLQRRDIRHAGRRRGEADRCYSGDRRPADLAHARAAPRSGQTRCRPRGKTTIAASKDAPSKASRLAAAVAASTTSNCLTRSAMDIIARTSFSSSPTRMRGIGNSPLQPTKIYNAGGWKRARPCAKIVPLGKGAVIRPASGCMPSWLI